MTKTGPIDFYFDFISPFGYFASLRIDALGAKHGREVVWRPMLLGVAVLKVMGLKPLLETPLKGEYLTKYAVPRYARLHKVPIDPRRFDEIGMAPVPPARAYWYLFARDPALAKRFAKDVLYGYWAERRDMAQPEALAEIAARHGVGRDEMIAGLHSKAAAERMRAEIDASIARGVFGSPFIIVDDEKFWGADNLEMLDLWLERGGW